MVKRGKNGQYLYDHLAHKRWMLPAYPVKMNNPTGAGDSFCGGFIAGYRQIYDPLESALFGNISASFTVEGNNPFYPLDPLPGLANARKDKLSELVRRA